jgi:hypothetical protein
MAVAAYDSDLTSSNGGEITIANDETWWDESTNSAWDDEGAPADEVNFYIQGSECISAQFTKTGVGTIIFDANGTTYTVDTDGAILIWAFWASPASLKTYANGGMRMLVGNSYGNFDVWKASGSDFEPNPLGGWYCYAVDPSENYDTRVGTGASSPYEFFGTAVDATAQARGYPNAVDAIRVGRCTLEVTEGQASAYGTFAGMEAFDDAGKYGLFQNIYGTYRWQGLMSLGVTGTAVDFRDSNVNISVANTPMVGANFNKIEIHNAGSNVEWSAINISSPGVNDSVAVTNSPGKLEVVDDADVTFNNCTFTDLDTFVFKGNSTVVNTTFRRTGQITTSSGVFTNCVIDSCVSGTSMLTDDVSNITGCTFTSDGSNHAVEATISGSYNWNNTTTGYATVSGSTGNETFYNNSGGHIDLTKTGGSTPSYRNGTSATTTVIIPSVLITISAPVTLNGAEIRIYDYESAPPDFGTELAGVESHTSATYVYNGTEDNLIYIQILKDGYVEFGQQYTIPSSDTGFYANLQVDTNI